MYQVTFFALVATAVFCFVAAAPQNPFLPTPSCGINEAAYPCGRRCEKKCNEELPGFCRGIQCEGFTCRCKNGFARNTETDRCVPVNECPVKKCAKGEIKGNCGRTCEATCAKQTPPEICQLLDCNPNAGNQCRCDFEAGYVRNEKTGKCVRAKNC